MKEVRTPRRQKTSGYALTIALLFTGIMLIFLASAIRWTSTSAGLTSRNNVYNSSVYAAEAATEQVLSRMDFDFVNQSLSAVLSTYNVLIPAQNGWPIQYQFSDGQGVPNQTGVQSLGTQMSTNLDSEFVGLYGLVSSYQVTSTARPINASTRPAATVTQQFQLALIPVFQFAIFYNLDLEINPGVAMVVTGKVHGNGNLYSAPPATLEFKDNVTSVGMFYNTRSTNDPTGGSKTMPLFDLGLPDQVGSLTLPTGANDNNPTNAVRFLDPPQPGEDPASPLGRERLYNNAMLIVSNSPTGAISVKTGEWNGFTKVTPDGTNAVTGVPTYSFVTNVTFYDYREKKPVQATQIDVAKFNTWLAKSGPTGGSSLNALAQLDVNHGLNSVYVMNLQSGSALDGVRVANGAQLPASGLTVATAKPLYVFGNFNLNNGDTTPGQTNTSLTQPASLIGDSVTILSSSWQDSYTSATAVSGRNPVNTTINAAILTGIVPSQADSSGATHYSGGVENLPRLLENWSSRTLTYNGSMVVMFASRYATNYWGNNNNIYSVPSRKWAFDMNFRNPNRLPPLAPSVRKLVRSQWQTIAGN